ALGVRLDLRVEGEPDVAPRRLGARGHDLEGATGWVLDDGLASSVAGERPVEGLLEPLEAAVVRAREPEHLRRDAILRIRAELLRVEPEARELELLERGGSRGVRLPRHVHEALRAIGQQRIDLLRSHVHGPGGREGLVAWPGDLLG